MAMKKSGLGRGLDSLFADNSSEDGKEVSTLRISDIEPNKDQPRKDFDAEALAVLADSIREHGVLQPILVRPISESRYQIVAGERRWRASKMAGLTEIPAVIREMTEEETMQLAMIENLQREDLNAIEEALGYELLMTRYHMTQDEVSKRVGKSRSAVANALRLLKLPKKTSELVRSGALSAGHARALLQSDDEALIDEVAEKIVRTGMSVRDAERAMKPRSPKRGEEKELSMDAEVRFCREMEAALGEELARRVKIDTKNGNNGTLQIEFFSQQDLSDLAQKLAKD
ncbi:MAG: ParB/RepB/Spo0J family partition protein [Ruminococcaceae bacterium]|nr:ParB/RepB/Spo0J family partition protein [Oscillospiraceae bacterium]